MNGGRITLTTSEQRRLIVLNHLESGALVNAEAARLLDLSVRQLQRMKVAYADSGAAALSHGDRGRGPVHALDPELARRVVELATTTYAGFNQQHLTELLNEEHGLAISRPSVHRILTAAGVPAPRKRRPPRHRRRRDRYAKAGMLLQVDTSRHDWLEGRGPHLRLVSAIADATSDDLSARVREHEGAARHYAAPCSPRTSQSRRGYLGPRTAGATSSSASSTDVWLATTTPCTSGPTSSRFLELKAASGALMPASRSMSASMAHSASSPTAYAWPRKYWPTLKPPTVSRSTPRLPISCLSH